MKPIVPVAIIIFFLFVGFIGAIPKVKNHFETDSAMGDTTEIVKAEVSLK